MKFGDNLQNLRKSKKMSQETLAEKVNVSRQSISKWERGESYPTMNNIMTLCDIFHCKINELVHENLTDINSLDEEIKMSIVKFKEEKQKQVKGLSKAIYIIARIGKVLTTIAIPLVIVSMLLMFYIAKNTNIVNDQIIYNGKNDKIEIVEENIEDETKVTLKWNNMVIADITSEDTIIQIKDVLQNNSKVSVISFVEIGLLFLVVCLILYRYTLKHLEELFININSGDTPFTLENVKHIKKMAYLLILAIILPSFAGFVFEGILKTDLDVDFGLISVFEILFLFSMSYIFEYGYEIQLDSKGKMYGNENE